MAEASPLTSAQTTTARPRGYPVDIIQGELNSKFQCGSCKEILKNPVQCFCGHRFCKDCVQFLISNANEGDAICQACTEAEDTTVLKSEEIFPDNAIRRELFKIPVSCKFKGCNFTGTFKDYEIHYNDCKFLPMLCNVCSQEIPRGELAAHTSSHSADKGCPFGCQEQISAENLSEHMRLQAPQHINVLWQRLSKLEDSVSSQSRSQINDPLAQRKLSELETKIQQLGQNLRQAGSGKGDGKVAVRGAEGGTSGGGDQSGVLTDIQQKMDIYEGVLTVLNREIEKLGIQADAIESKQRTDHELVDNLENKVKALERQLAIKQANIAELELRITALEQTSHDGTLLWRITDFKRRRQEAISGRTPSVYSPPFYTSKTGYKMCARIYLNGDGMGKGTHVSLFFVLMRGNFDPLLRWPFRQKVTLMFLDQNNREHVVDAFRPDPTSSSFKRPVSEMNIASGCPLLMPLSTLDNQSHGYAKDNTAFIKIIVSTEDID